MEAAQLHATCIAHTDGPAIPGVHVGLLFAYAHVYLYVLPTTPGLGLLSPAWKT